MKLFVNDSIDIEAEKEYYEAYDTIMQENRENILKDNGFSIIALNYSAYDIEPKWSELMEIVKSTGSQKKLDNFSLFRLT